MTYYDKASPKTKTNRKKYNQSPKTKAAINKRNRDRRAAIKSGKVKRGDGKDVHHSGSFATGSTSVKSASENRRKGGAKGGRRSHGGGRPKGS